MALVDLLLVVGIIAGIYSLLAIGMNMHWGDTGLLNFAHAAFFAVGAYTSAILTTPPATGSLATRVVGFDFPIIVGLVAGTALAGVVGVLIALPSVRLEGDYLAIVTLSAAELIRLLIHNEAWLTTGAQTLKNIPRPLDGAIPVSYDLFYFVLVWAIVAVCYLLFERLSSSPFGRVLHAIRENDDVPLALGKNTYVFKLKSFGIGAAIAGLAGGLWAHYVYAISSIMFLPSITFLIWAAVIIGGAGSYGGAILGASVIVGLRQITRFIPGDVPFGDQLSYIRLMVVGVVLILVLYYRPEGLLGDAERLQAGTSE
ncbi:branched-chain amino acid ABC transporter permease [Haloplanus rallus]|uniref:Branched-chain amino acid ABC transporter permease n=1 Tax=Haloplanus rallus TaxID=1816183 RepID=A0A6B9FAW0_9EURY|nr:MULTISPECIES: branched-chain amino acid ABC transporter permease [Haloplanus]QGX95491.1 branched-chain amino acid ABC transporter permease [Haloplanus rallus]